MIDTSKYEGHTPAPWKQAKPKDSNPRITTQFCDDEIIVNTGATSWEADIQLIADAPLLLQALIDEQVEVKRLREVIDEEHPTFDWSSRQTIANLEAEVKQLRKQVSKAKEWVRSYFINMSGDFNSLEDKVVYDDFMQQMGMKKND
tara:strand:+ start:496 stop:933 length:438 start_codon:yes stop_codon:yes gene_type:complete